MNWADHITSTPNINHGKPSVKGTRVLVSTLLDNLGHGISTETILKNYPSITQDDIYAAIQYAADLANDRIIQLST